MKEIKNVVTWLKNWFYDTTQIDNFLANKVNKNQGNANYNVVTNSSGEIVVEPKPTAETIVDGTAHSNIGTTANATQANINTAVDNMIGTLKSIKALQVVETLPTASANTMNRLYIISENSKVNVYYTKQTGSNYEWVKMDANILDELTWNDIQNKPSVFPPETHLHGNITNDGKIGQDSGKIITTGTNGLLQASSDIGAGVVKDSNGHVSGIGSTVNATQATINTLIDSQLATINGKFQQLRVFFINQNDLPISSEYSYTELYIVRYHLETYEDKYEWRMYYWKNIPYPYFRYELDYIVLSLKGDAVTSISLVPKGSDPTADAYNGVIRLYYGDEP